MKVFTLDIPNVDEMSKQVNVSHAFHVRAPRVHTMIQVAEQIVEHVDKDEIELPFLVHCVSLYMEETMGYIPTKRAVSEILIEHFRNQGRAKRALGKWMICKEVTHD